MSRRCIHEDLDEKKEAYFDSLCYISFLNIQWRHWWYFVVSKNEIRSRQHGVGYYPHEKHLNDFQSCLCDIQDNIYMRGLSLRSTVAYETSQKICHKMWYKQTILAYCCRWLSRGDCLWTESRLLQWKPKNSTTIASDITTLVLCVFVYQLVL